MRRYLIIVITLCLAAGVGAYVATRAAAPPPGPPAVEALMAWLKLSPEQAAKVKAEDPKFEQEAAQKSKTLKDERLKLARLLEAPKVNDQEVLAQLKKVNFAENDLEMYVAEYVLKIRRHLNPDQRKKLMGLVANGLREGAARHLK
jgi:Spy/CpxP family protein refolding chaperone